jgi:hypothetical protein
MSTFRGRLSLAVLGALLAASPRAAAQGIDDEPSGFSALSHGTNCTGAGTLDGGVYVDAAYLHSTNEPANHEWRSKGTSAHIGGVSLNNASAFFEKETCDGSRFGFQIGFQAGRDVDALVPSDPVDAAETLKHLYNTNVSYLAPAGDGLLLTGGLIPGHLGYESFWAVDNATYTRVYAGDLVPYFHWGLNVTYPSSGRLTTSLLVVNGWDYLANPNSLPSYGLQLTWNTTAELWLRLNLYYGPEQEKTSLDTWRFVSDVVGEWQFGDFRLAANAGYGREKQSDLPGNPTHHWVWASGSFQWQPLDHLRVAVRPELLVDEDGLASGARQTIGAVTGALDVPVPVPWSDTFVRFEYRYDRSTGLEGGFFKGAENELVPNQHLLIAAINWRFRPLGR